MTNHTNELEKYGITDDMRQPCEIWTRVMGYHRPIDSFNIGKKGNLRKENTSKRVNALVVAIKKKRTS